MQVITNLVIAGIGLCVVLIVIIVCSMKWVRKSGNFEVSHDIVCSMKWVRKSGNFEVSHEMIESAQRNGSASQETLR